MAAFTILTIIIFIALLYIGIRFLSEGLWELKLGTNQKGFKTKFIIGSLITFFATFCAWFVLIHWEHI